MKKVVRVPQPIFTSSDPEITTVKAVEEEKSGQGNKPQDRELRTKKLTLCMTPSTYEILERKAHKNGMAASTYANFLLMKFCGTFDDMGL